ncbi:hypothetical protein ABPG75_012347 [Micractinium tetrahymenae]
MVLALTQSAPSQAGSRPAAAQSSRCPRQQHRRQFTAVAALQRPFAAATVQRSGGGSGSAQPLAAALLAAVQTIAALQLAVAAPALADGSDFRISSQAPGPEAAEEEQYFETVPQGLSSADSSTAPRLGSLLEGPKGKQIQQCTRKCVPTCIRGGQGSPGLGPMSVRKEIIVFKEGYRSRSYCLSECTQVCALTINPQGQPGEPAK